MEGADSTKHTQTETRGRGCQEVKGGDGSKPCARARSQPLPALTYRGRPAAFAPRSLSIHVHVGLARRFIPCFSSNVTPCMLGSPTLATCRCRAATVFTYLLIPCFSGSSVDFSASRHGSTSARDSAAISPAAAVRCGFRGARGSPSSSESPGPESPSKSNKVRRCLTRRPRWGAPPLLPAGRWRALGALPPGPPRSTVEVTVAAIDAEFADRSAIKVQSIHRVCA